MALIVAIERASTGLVVGTRDGNRSSYEYFRGQVMNILGWVRTNLI